MKPKPDGQHAPENQRWMCQRDFYYELWDLHTNPGEKNLCSRKYSVDVWEAMREEGGYQARLIYIYGINIVYINVFRLFLMVKFK